MVGAARPSPEVRRGTGDEARRRGALPPLASLFWLAAALPATLWSMAALAIDGPGLLAAALFGLAALALLSLRRSRSLGRLALVGLLAGNLGWWLGLEPRADRDWAAEVARAPRMQVRDGRLLVSELRAFEYPDGGPALERWQQRELLLDDVRGLDLFLCDWGAKGVVHTILSWEVAGAEPLAISIESRKERGEEYSALRGFFRQYELHYVVGLERDLVALRAALRGERVRLYRIAAAPELARAFLLAYAGRVERLAQKPAWYNALTHNCTTAIHDHVLELGVLWPWDWRLLVNGRIDALLHARGLLGDLPLSELREIADVTERARTAIRDERFSERIRAGLPPRGS